MGQNATLSVQCVGNYRCQSDLWLGVLVARRLFVYIVHLREDTLTQHESEPRELRLIAKRQISLGLIMS